MVSVSTSQDRLGYAAVKNNPYISVISSNKNGFFFIIRALHMPVRMGSSLCPGHPHSEMEADWISTTGQLQSVAKLELIGLFLKGFYRELVHVVSVPISWAKARHMAILISMEAGTNDLIMCFERGEPKIKGVHKIRKYRICNE